MKKLVGFFGGSFDPIHFGHLNLIVELSERAGLDKVLICPTFLSPLKKQSPSQVASNHRLNMVRLATEDIPKVSVIEEEIHQKKETYTYETLCLLKEKEPANYRLMIAEDLISELPKWHKVKNLLALAPPLIGSRSYNLQKNMEGLGDNCKKIIRDGCVEIPLMDISSRVIRERIQKKLYVGHLLPRKVLDYIYTHRLYYPN